MRARMCAPSRRCNTRATLARRVAWVRGGEREAVCVFRDEELYTRCPPCAAINYRVTRYARACIEKNLSGVILKVDVYMLFVSGERGRRGEERGGVSPR